MDTSHNKGTGGCDLIFLSLILFYVGIHHPVPPPAISKMMGSMEPGIRGSYRTGKGYFLAMYSHIASESWNLVTSNFKSVILGSCLFYKIWFTLHLIYLGDFF